MRSDDDSTRYSLVGSGRSREGGPILDDGSPLLGNLYTPYQCMGGYLSSTG